ncbi:MAG: phosphatase PAP2 family protein [Polyangiaceae bacterium]
MAVSRVGLLGLLSAVALLSGLVIRNAAQLPVAYDWSFPYRVLWWDGVGTAGFPRLLLGVVLLGWFSSGAWPSLRARLARQATRRDAHALVAALVCVACVAWVDAELCEQHSTLDNLAAGVMLVLAALHARKVADAPSAARLLASTAYGALCFGAICFFYTVVKATLFLHAFPHDASILALETRLFGAPPHRALAAWAATRPVFVRWCDWTYFRLFEHMLLTGALLIARRDSVERIEYMGALALCYLMGCVLYHLLPAWGPGYFEPRYFAYLDDPTLKTSAVRAWLWDNTQAVSNGRATRLVTWSYISCMPSLHVSHEIVMAFYSRRPLPALLASAAFTLATLVAVVVLGWHYPLDGVAGAALAVIAILVARKLSAYWWPRQLVVAASTVPSTQ